MPHRLRLLFARLCVTCSRWDKAWATIPESLLRLETAWKDTSGSYIIWRWETLRPGALYTTASYDQLFYDSTAPGRSKPIYCRKPGCTLSLYVGLRSGCRVGRSQVVSRW